MVVLTVAAVVGSSCATDKTGKVATRTTPGVERSPGCGRPASKETVAPGRQRSVTVASGVVTGSYQLSVPPRYGRGRPAPLILLVYGFDSDPSQFSAVTGLPARGSRDGYLVVVPHDRAGETEFPFTGHGTDAQFVAGLVRSLEGAYCVDQRAVFAAGFSAGAAFAIAYTCAHEDQIAALATVAVEFQLGCTRPMSIVAFHGTADPLVPYRNGAVGLSRPGVPMRGTELNMGTGPASTTAGAIPAEPSSAPRSSASSGRAVPTGRRSSSTPSSVAATRGREPIRPGPSGSPRSR
jgi:polyhydroxybutyrate depolymerase